MPFSDELDDILRELLREPGILAVATGAPEGSPFSAAVSEHAMARTRDLGGGAELKVLVTEEQYEPSAAAVERISREIRDCARRWNAEAIPETLLYGRARRTRDALVDRVRRYIEAFAEMHGAAGAVVLKGADIIAAGGNVGGTRRQQLTFLRKRVDSEAARTPGTSHAELVTQEAYACSFGYDGYLIAFFDGPWATDFVKHRAHLVTQELAALLPHLDDDPDPPASIHPIR